MILPLKGAADGLGIILQILDNESSRADDFYEQLKSIEYQAARVAANPNFDMKLQSTRDLLKEKGINLMTAIIKFFNSALHYFSQSYPEKILKIISEGSEKYNDGKSALQRAIREYDQAVADLTVSLISGLFTWYILSFPEMRYEQKLSQEKSQNNEFLDWLSSSYWQVKAQLSALRRQRAEGTLQWVQKLDGLQQWRSGEITRLWIRGHPGVGKSTIAAHIVDFLKCLYPDSIVAYFFCKGGHPGLMRARDIICTLASHCIENKGFREAVYGLKNSGFKTCDDVGVVMLFEKLLKEPLSHCDQQVFIILDGIDEADDTIQDAIERKSQMHLLLDCLANLQNDRILFISRPPSDVLRFAPGAKIKSITIEDNRDDITTYVRNTVSGSRRLERYFQNAEIQPDSYLVSKANGIFLWVDLVIQQLAKAKSRTAFEVSLKGFSQASGDMNQLYSCVLAKMDIEDQRWVKEILKWLVASKRDLTVGELQAAVEWSLRDELDNFTEFLEVQCGSIIILVPQTERYNTVQLVHETFRFFLAERSVCPQEFFIHDAALHSFASLTCLNILSSLSSDHPLYRYASDYWHHHLADASISSQEPQVLLLSLHRFFNSEGIIAWLKHVRASYYGRGYNAGDEGQCVRSEKMHVSQLHKWLSRSEMALSNVTESWVAGVDEAQVRAAWEWGQTILQSERSVDEIIGAVSCRMWLESKTDDPRHLATDFIFALEYYLTRETSSMNRLDEVQELGSTKFRNMIIWSGNGERRVDRRALGVGYFNLRYWEDGLRCFSEEDISDQEFKVWRYLGEIHQSMGNYGDAARAFEKALANAPVKDSVSDWYWGYGRGLWHYLIDAYTANHDLERANHALERATQMHPTNDVLLKRLECIYKVGGDSKKLAVEIFQNAAAKYPTDAEHLDRLYRIYIEDGEFEKANVLVDNAANLIPNDLWPWYRLSKRHKNNDCSLEIQALERSLDILRTFSGDVPVSWSHNRAWPSKIYQNSLYQRMVTEIGSRLTNAYIQSADFTRAIATLQRAVQMLNPFDRWQLTMELLKVYLKVNDFGRAIDLIETTYNKTVSECIDEAHRKDGLEVQTSTDNDRMFEDILRVYEAEGKWCKANSNFDAATVAFKLGITLQHDAARFWCGLAGVYMAKGDYNAMIATLAKYRLTEAANLKRNKQDPWKDFAYECQWKGNCDDVIALFKCALREDSIADRWLDYYWRLSLLLIAKGDVVEAIRVLEAAVGTKVSEANSFCEQESDWSEFVLAWRWGDSTKEFGNELKPIDYKIWETLLEAYQAKELEVGVIEALQNLLDIGIKRYKYGMPWLFGSLSHIYETMGNNTGAIKAYSDAIDSLTALGTNNPYYKSLEEFWPKVCWPWSEVAKGKYDAAISVLEKALLNGSIAMESKLEVLWKANKAKGDLDRSIKFLESAIPKIPCPSGKLSVCIEFLAQAYKVKGYETPEAVRRFKKECNLIYPSNSDLLRFALVADAIGDHDSAIKAYMTVCERDDDAYMLLDKVLVLFVAKADYDNAISIFSTLVEKSKRLRDIPNTSWKGLLDAYELKGDFHGAIARIKQLTETCDSGEADRIWRRIIDITRGDYEKTIKVISSIIEIYPHRAWPWKSLGEAFYAHGEFDESITAYQRAIRNADWGFFFRPTRTCIWFRLAEAYTAKCDYDNAIETCKTAIKRNPKESWDAEELSSAEYIFYKRIGDLYREQGKYAKSIEAYNLALQTAPHESFLWACTDIVEIDYNEPPVDRYLIKAFIWNSLGEAYEACGKRDSAVKLYDTVLSKYLENVKDKKPPWNDLLWRYITEAELWDWRPARNRQRDLSQAILWTVIGEAWKAKGDKVHAIEAFQKALKEEEENQWLQEVIADLSMLENILDK